MSSHTIIDLKRCEQAYACEKGGTSLVPMRPFTTFHADGILLPFFTYRILIFGYHFKKWFRNSFVLILALTFIDLPNCHRVSTVHSKSFIRYSAKYYTLLLLPRGSRSLAQSVGRAGILLLQVHGLRLRLSVTQ